MPFYAAEALQTLDFLHKHNIVFRDLKPENIMFAHNDNLMKARTDNDCFLDC